MKKIFCLYTFLATFLLAFAQNNKEVSVDNFHKVDEGLYRSGQPTKSDFKELEKFGITSVLNLRNHHSDNDEAKGTKIKLYRIKMNAGSLTEEDLLVAIKVIKNRQGPLLVHCWHGSDRTGAVIAMYRILYQNWTKEKAIDELVNGGYGYHKYYGNIPELIKNIDVENFKKRLKG